MQPEAEPLALWVLARAVLACAALNMARLGFLIELTIPLALATAGAAMGSLVGRPGQGALIAVAAPALVFLVGVFAIAFSGIAD